MTTKVLDQFTEATSKSWSRIKLSNLSTKCIHQGNGCTSRRQPKDLTAPMRPYFIIQILKFQKPLKMRLYFVMAFSLIACVNQNPKQHQGQMDSTLARQGAALDKKKLELIEAVLNLPTVVRMSKVEFIREKYQEIYVLIGDAKDNNETPKILQKGQPIRILRNANSITEDTPCYIFDRMDVLGDSAYVRLRFDMTGAMAFGSLKYTDKQWVPDKGFLVGVR